MPLKRRKKKERQRRPCARVAIVAAAMLAGLALFASGFLLFAGIYAREHLDFSADAALFESAKGGNVTVFYYDGSPSPSGELDGYLPTEIRTAAKAENQKLWFSLDEMPDTVKNAAVAVEDRKFYEHRGVDLLRTVYALANAIFHFRGSFGASTITQQVIKNISGDSEPTVRRKWNEILRAIELEKRYTKEEILEVYLNILPMSENAIGIGAGAKTYFGKDPADLTLAESAVLIGIANAPTRYNPYLHPEEPTPACRSDNS